MYYKIVNRYESTITAQIFGHSHYDELNLFYDLQNLTRPVSVSYLGKAKRDFALKAQSS